MDEPDRPPFQYRVPEMSQDNLGCESAEKKEYKDIRIMEGIIMKNKRFKIGCLAVAIFLLLAVFAGCSGDSQETSAVTGSAQINESQTPDQTSDALTGAQRQ